MLASFVELRVSYLRVCIDMQGNPRSVDSSMEHLKSIIDYGIVFWQFLQDRSQVLKGGIRELEARLQEMNWAARNFPSGEGASVEKELGKRKAAYTSTKESEREIMSDFHSLIESAGTTRKALETSGPTNAATSPTLVYWKDDTGEHSFVTEKNVISS